MSPTVSPVDIKALIWTYMMVDINKIHWHDSGILRVIEVPDEEKIIFEIDYPVDWESEKYEKRLIEFSDIYTYQIKEGPFSGKVTILDLIIEGDQDQEGISTFRIETNAGYRIIKCKKIDLIKGNYNG